MRHFCLSLHFARLFPLVVALGATLGASQPALAGFAQQGSKLVGTGASGSAGQGASTALSSDGNTMIVGGPLDNGNFGAVWIYTRNDGVWSQQGDKLTGTGAIGHPQQGRSVALSADGNTAIVGGPEDNSEAGAAWVFTRGGGVWTQQGPKLPGIGGVSVALSADGNTAIVGGGNGDAGAAWVFIRSGGVWAQQGDKLVGTGAVGDAAQGSVALSADGNTAIVGGFGDNSEAGAAWVFVRSSGVWSQQGAKLVGTGAINGTLGAQQGSSVTLSADGNTAILGGPGDNSGVGAAWVFSRSGGVWTQQGSKLVGTGAAGMAQQGSSVRLSADGNAAIVGGYYDNSFIGAAWVFTRSGTSWSQQGSKLVGTGAAGAAFQGTSVAFSADGNTASVGGQNDNSNAGAVWVFTQPVPPTVTGVSPNRLRAGQSANVVTTIFGINFTGTTAVHFGGTPSPSFSASATSIDADIPPNSGTVDITVTTPAGTSAITAADQFTYLPATATHDFNADGISDILWRHTNGSTSVWQMAANGTHTPLNPGTLASDWQIAGTTSLVASTGDVNLDGKDDIFWRNTNGSLLLWEMNGGAHTALSLGVVNTAWQIAGVGDFDGDGHADILWRHTNGSLSIWKMAANGTHTPLNFGVVPTAWQVAGIGDVNGDGNADIIWRHTNGSLVIWAMHGGTSHTVLNLGTVPTAWQIAGVGDLDGDAIADIFWRNSNGSLSVWLMAANGTHTPLNLGAVATAWQIVSIGDYSGHFHSDILWRNTNGAVSIWKMNPNGTHTPLSLGTVPTAWTIVE